MNNFHIVFAALLFVGCTAPDRTTETLEKSGYTDIQITGHSPFTCSNSDLFSTGFTATNPLDKRVSGTVCCGMLKSCTIRF